jgi:hypothetical protein
MFETADEHDVIDSGFLFELSSSSGLFIGITGFNMPLG